MSSTEVDENSGENISHTADNPLFYIDGAGDTAFGRSAAYTWHLLVDSASAAHKMILAFVCAAVCAAAPPTLHDYSSASGCLLQGLDAEGTQDTHGIDHGNNAGAHHRLDLEQLNELQSNSSASSDDDFE